VAVSYKSYKASSQAASRAKKRNQGGKTRAELTLRRELWRRGLRYRVKIAGLLGKPDIIFPKAQLAVFVDGDFWHGRNWLVLKEALSRRANSGYWIPKIDSNRNRDLDVTAELESLGWCVLRFWETEVLADIDRCATIVQRALAHRCSRAQSVRVHP
jgi:DNA mismatch endonuclease, patch repair protein